jgi:hypothetical protein
VAATNTLTTITTTVAITPPTSTANDYVRFEHVLSGVLSSLVPCAIAVVVGLCLYHRRQK